MRNIKNTFTRRRTTFIVLTFALVLIVIGWASTPTAQVQKVDFSSVPREPIQPEIARKGGDGEVADAIRSLSGCNANTLPANDDSSTGSINLPFTLNYFGQMRSALFVNNNGNVTFGGALGTFTPFSLNTSTTPIIAPFFADVDTSGQGSGLTRYGNTTVDGRMAFCVNWIAVGYFSGRTDKLNSFQLLLIDRSDTGAGNFDIEFNYNTIIWETGNASGGTNGLGGNSARAGYANGSTAAGTFFEFPGSAVNGALLDSNGATGLTNTSRNSGVRGRHIFSARSGAIPSPTPTPTATPTPTPDPNATPTPTPVPGACAFTLDPPVQDFPPSGGPATVRVVQTSGGPPCRWDAFSSAVTPPFFSVATSGTGTGSFTFTVGVNESNEGRSGIVTIVVDHPSPPPERLAVATFTANQPAGGGTCTFRFEQGDTTVDSGAGQGSVNMVTQDGCQWTPVSTAPAWLRVTDPSMRTGPGPVAYTFENHTGQDTRTGSITARGAAFSVLQNSGTSGNCVVDIILCFVDPMGCRLFDEAHNGLNQFHRFRDNVLAKTERGKKYADDYYQYTGEITRLLIFNPSLLYRSKDVIERYQPVLESVLKREGAIADRERAGETVNQADLEPVIIFDSEIDDVTELLAMLSAQSSESLRGTLENLRRDIRDPHVQAEFAVKVVKGEKRPLPGKDRNGLEKLGGIWELGSERPSFSPSLDIHRPAVATPHRDAAPSPGVAPTAGPADDKYGQIPLSFEANQGQVDRRVKFLSRGAGYNLFLTETEAVLSLRGQSERKGEFEDPELITRLSNPAVKGPDAPAQTLRLRLDGANKRPRLIGHNKVAGKSNYFIGRNSASWRIDIPNYSKVEYEEVYKGIDLVYYGNQRQLEYDFKVAPGADPGKIKMSFTGADNMEIDAGGDLVLHTAGGEVRMRAPVTYQEVKGVRHEIASRYTLNKISKLRSETSDSYTVAFEVGSYDRTKPLVIDPVLQYSTYLGGSGEDLANSITTDSAGNAYLIGFTDSTNFPVAGAIQSTYGGNPQDVFVSKLNAAGTALVYSTYLGGSGQDNGSDIAVDSAGNAYITGYAGSSNFPTANALQPTRTGFYNAFVAKLNPTGSQLIYSTYFGGTIGEFGSSIAIDAAGNAYVGGVTSSSNFPDAPGAPQPVYGGGFADGFLAKLNAAGSQVIYATNLGGNANDGVTSIAIDAAGNAYATGVTFSSNFPTANPLQPNFRGGAFDTFVTKINPAGTAWAYSSYMGGTDEDRGFRIGLDTAGNIYVVGMTLSSNFPTANALQPTFGGGSDAFVTKLSPAGAILNSTFLGGTGLDGATGLDVTGPGAVYVTGFTTSTNFPVVAPIQAAYGGGEFDAFAAKYTAAGALQYSTYLGGAGYDTGFDIETDSAGTAYLAGRTASTNFPTMNPFQAANGGGAFDLFITRIADVAGIGGLEGDLAPRPAGDGVFRANDLEVVRQFFAGTAVDPNSNEFQRADVAPFETRGNGALNAADIQQLRNYIAQLSPPQAAGGPVAAAAIPALLEDDRASRSLRIVSMKSGRDKVTIAVELDALGDEVGVSFSLLFDPAHLSSPVVEMGTDAPAGAVLTVNTKLAGEGRLGVLVDSDNPLERSSHGPIVTITFERGPAAHNESTPVAFDSWPIGIGLSDRNAGSLPVRHVGSRASFAKDR